MHRSSRCSRISHRVECYAVHVNRQKFRICSDIAPWQTQTVHIFGYVNFIELSFPSSYRNQYEKKTPLDYVTFQKLKLEWIRLWKIQKHILFGNDSIKETGSIWNAGRNVIHESTKHVLSPVDIMQKPNKPSIACHAMSSCCSKKSVHSICNVQQLHCKPYVSAG